MAMSCAVENFCMYTPRPVQFTVQDRQRTDSVERTHCERSVFTRTQDNEMDVQNSVGDGKVQKKNKVVFKLSSRKLVKPRYPTANYQPRLETIPEVNTPRSNVSEGECGSWQHFNPNSTRYNSYSRYGLSIRNKTFAGPFETHPTRPYKIGSYNPPWERYRPKWRVISDKMKERLKNPKYLKRRDDDFHQFEEPVAAKPETYSYNVNIQPVSCRSYFPQGTQPNGPIARHDAQPRKLVSDFYQWNYGYLNTDPDMSKVPERQFSSQVFGVYPFLCQRSLTHHRAPKERPKIRTRQQLRESFTVPSKEPSFFHQHYEDIESSTNETKASELPPPNIFPTSHCDRIDIVYNAYNQCVKAAAMNPNSKKIPPSQNDNDYILKFYGKKVGSPIIPDMKIFAAGIAAEIEENAVNNNVPVSKLAEKSKVDPEGKTHYHTVSHTHLGSSSISSMSSESYYHCIQNMAMGLNIFAYCPPLGEIKYVAELCGFDLPNARSYKERLEMIEKVLNIIDEKNQYIEKTGQQHNRKGQRDCIKSIVGREFPQKPKVSNSTTGSSTNKTTECKANAAHRHKIQHKDSAHEHKIQPKDAAHEHKIQSKDAAHGHKIPLKDTAHEHKIQPKDASHEHKIQAKNSAHESKIQSKDAAHEHKIQAKDAALGHKIPPKDAIAAMKTTAQKNAVQIPKPHTSSKKSKSKKVKRESKLDMSSSKTSRESMVKHKHRKSTKSISSPSNEANSKDSAEKPTSSGTNEVKQTRPTVSPTIMIATDDKETHSNENNDKSTESVNPEVGKDKNAIASSSETVNEEVAIASKQSEITMEKVEALPKQNVELDEENIREPVSTVKSSKLVIRGSIESDDDLISDEDTGGSIKSLHSDRKMSDATEEDDKYLKTLFKRSISMSSDTAPGLSSKNSRESTKRKRSSFPNKILKKVAERQSKKSIYTLTSTSSNLALTESSTGTTDSNYNQGTTSEMSLMKNQKFEQKDLKRSLIKDEEQKKQLGSIKSATIISGKKMSTKMRNKNRKALCIDFHERAVKDKLSFLEKQKPPQAIKKSKKTQTIDEPQQHQYETLQSQYNRKFRKMRSSANLQRREYNEKAGGDYLRSFSTKRQDPIKDELCHMGLLGQSLNSFIKETRTVSVALLLILMMGVLFFRQYDSLKPQRVMFILNKLYKSIFFSKDVIKPKFYFSFMRSEPLSFFQKLYLLLKRMY